MGKIKFDHAVIYGGVLYPANTLIEEKKGKATVSKEETVVAETPKKATKKAGAKDNADNGTV